MSNIDEQNEEFEISNPDQPEDQSIPPKDDFDSDSEVDFNFRAENLQEKPKSKMKEKKSKVSRTTVRWQLKWVDLREFRWKLRA